jgi:putative flippase GtrA
MTKSLKLNSALHQLFRYFLVGGAAFIVEFSSFALLIHVLQGKYDLQIAQTLSFCGGLITSFVGNKFITFNHAQKEYLHSHQVQFVKYVVLAIGNLLLTNTLIYLLVNHASLKPLIAKVLLMASVALWNYVIFKRYIFKVS